MMRKGGELNATSRYSIYKEIMKRSKLLGDLRTPVDSNHFPPDIEGMLWEAFLEYDRINL